MARKIFLSIAIILTAISMVLPPAILLRYPGGAFRTLGISTHTLLTYTGQALPYETPNGVHPYLQAKVDSLIKDARSNGIDLRVVRGYRSVETQLEYYNQGRTTPGAIITYAPPGFSYHNYGLAVDVCEYVNGKPNWHSKHWDEIGRIGKKHGLVWGGDWKLLVDRPHFQLSKKDILLHCLLSFKKGAIKQN
jgi:hypothetical protein